MVLLADNQQHHLFGDGVLIRSELTDRFVPSALRSAQLEYAASDANFLLIEVGDDAPAIYDRLLHRGVITRPMQGFGLPRHLRVTAGLPAENERFLAALATELGR